jgi:gliding motility-associated-like protein
MQMKFTFLGLLLFLTVPIIAQQPVPCTNGTQNTCQCSTSPIICTIDDLDGYQYDMTTYLHPSHGPQPMCPPPEGNNTASHNPTWFRFPAWCTDLELEVCYNNCVDGPACFGGGDFGIQAAVYEDCSLNPNSAVGCDTDVAGCVNNSCRIVSMSGLIIGDIYGFLVDGCCGSACEITINVIGVCGDPVIGDFTDIDGPTYVCAGGDTSEYFHPRPDGANTLHWFIDGAEVQVGGGGSARFFKTVWTTPGTYELCFDASNDPCIDVNDPPEPTCITVEVYEIVPIDPDPGYVCPGETYFFDGTQYGPGSYNFNFENDQGCDSNTVLEVILVPIVNDTIGPFTLCQGECVNVGGTDYCAAGNFTITLEQENPPNCDSILHFEVIVLDANDGNLTVQSPLCPGATSALSVTGFNNSPGFQQYIIVANSAGVIVAVYNGGSGSFSHPVCASFTVYTLNFHPDSGVTAPVVGANISSINCMGGCCEMSSLPLVFQDTQAPTFVNPPASVTLACYSLITSMPVLTWNDNCQGSGTVAGVETGSATLCQGGTITRTWTKLDTCGNQAQHVQTITVNVLPIADWVNPPPDITIVCDSIPTSAPPLSYTNNTPGACLIAGSVAGTLTGTANLCGGVLTNMWSFTDTCGRVITHSRTITVEPTPLPTWQNPPINVVIPCDSIPTAGPPLVISNGLTGNCGINDTITPVLTGSADLCGGEITLTWEYTDTCGTTFEHVQVLTVNPTVQADFVNPPGNITVDCANIPTTAPDLQLTNGQPGGCLITGTVPAVITGSADLCGGTITHTWTFTDTCDRVRTHTRTVTATPVPQATFVNPPGNITVDCANIPTSAPSLTYTNGLVGACLITGTVPAVITGSADLCGGTITNTWTFTDPCGRQTTHVQTVTVTPVPAATFQNPPASITVDCANIPTSAPPLSYTNGLTGACAITGSVPAVMTGSANLCGGTITFTWTFTDVCGRTITHVQNVTATPVPTATFTNPPASITVDCANIPTSASPLTYTNGLTGACAISGVVPAVITGSANLCGGTITNTWTFTDACGRTITHVQNITATPVPQADFVNPPQNITVDCYNIPTSAPPLNYTNGLTGACAITGSVTAVTTGSANLCGGTITNTWTFTDVCGRTRTHVQTVTVTPIQPAAFINPPANLNVSCQNIPTSAPPLSYTNGETGNCAITGSVPAVMSGSADLCGGVIQFTWTFTDQCGRTITHIQTVIAAPVPPATFVNPPQSMTITCAEIPGGAPVLNYTNGLTGNCAITGSIPAVVTGGGDLCGGQINNTWTFTDQCGRIIQHVQILTVTPVPEGEYQNPPQSITVTCDQIPSAPGNLTLTNGLGGACGIFASVAPILVGNPDVCGSQYSYRWDFTDACGRTKTHSQFITVIPTPAGVFQNPPANITVSCAAVNENPPFLNYTNNQSGQCAITGSVPGQQTGSYDPCGGTLQNTWTYTDDCNRTITHTQNVTVLPAPPAVFESFPADMTVTCDNIPGPDEFINYSNNLSGNCTIQGAVQPTQSGTFDACGGEISFEWNFQDDCGRQISHTQNITILPAAPPSFVGPPDDATITCTEAEFLDPTPLISYSNYLGGNCENSGSVYGVQTANYNECGGTIEYTWTLDACGNPVTYTQVLTVLPGADPVMENPLADITLECGQPFPPHDQLYYFNNESGICEIEGFADPMIVVVNNNQIITWEYISPCNGKKITKVRNIIGKPTPNMDVVPDTARICLGQSFNLGTVQIVDVNNAFPTITFHSGTPATPANLISNPVVSPTVNTTYYVLGTTQYGCKAEVTFTLMVDSPVTAGGNGSGYLCDGASGIDLFDYLVGPYSTPGNWVDPFNSGIDIFPPTDVSFNNANPGVYTFWYVVASNGACPGDTAVVSLTLVPEINVIADSLVCQQNLDFYDVYFTLSGFTASVSIGNLNNLGGGKYAVLNIPVDSSLTVTGTDPASGCSNTIVINPPNCNCPPVLPPVNLGDQEICFGEPTPTLSVTVGPDDVANWYSAPNGGTLLAGNSLTYTPPVSAPGTYVYYVEAANALFPECKSFIRTPVTLDILNVPTVQNGILKSCDTNADGFATFTLSQANPQINGNPLNTIVYYASAADAQNQMNPLPNSFTNTVPGQQTLYAVVTNSAGCFSQAQLTLIVFPTIQLSLNITGETCLGDEDGIVVISSTGGTGQVLYSLTNSNFNAVTTYNNMAPGSYTAFARDTFNCSVSSPFVIPEGLDLEILNFTVVCNNNGTTSDAADDFYTITFTVNNNKGNVGTYTVTSTGVNQGPYAYGQVQSFTIPANGQSLVLNFADVAKGCPQTQQIGPLNPCSTDCLLTISLLSKVCNDNGTNADPIDDFYTFTVNATAINPGTGNMFNVFAGGVPVGTFTYGVGGTFTLPADGSNPVILFVDSNDQQCFDSQSAGDLITCSNTCVLSATIDSIKCDNLGTGSDFLDDVFTFELTVTGLNTSGSWYVSGAPAVTFSYGTVQLFGPYLIANGPFVLTLVDSNDPNCTIAVNVTPPPPCSEPCILETANVVIGNCNNNNTGPITTDDFFTATFTVTSVSGAVTQYVVNWNGQTWGPYNYGSMATIDSLPANGQPLTLTIVDANNAQCVVTLVVSQNPCSECLQTAEAGPGFVFDCFIKNAVLQGSAVPSNGSFSWSGPNNFMSTIPTPLVSFPGVYILTVTYPNQCQAIDSLEITVDPTVPVADAGPDRILTCKQDSVLLDGSLSSTGPDQIYVWTDINNNTVGSAQSIWIKVPGTYFLQVIDLAKNCTSPIDQVVVTEDKVYPLAPIYADPAEILNCVIDNVLLFTDAQPNVVFTWMQNTNTTTGLQVIINQPGVVILTAVDTVNGCSATKQITIEDQTEYPIVNVANPGRLNCKDSQVLIDASQSQDGATIVYLWYDATQTLIPNGNQKTILVNTIGTYYLVVQDTANGCTNRDTIEIFGDYDFPIVDAGQTVFLPCDVYLTGLSGTASNVGPSPAFNWTSTVGVVISGGNTLTPQVEGSAWYNLAVTNTENGCISIDSVFVQANADEPRPDLEIDPITCKGFNDGALLVKSIINGQPPYTLTLNGEVNNSGLFAPLGPGTYTLQIEDVNNCKFDTTFTLLEGIELLISLSATSILVLEGDSAVVEAIVNIPPSQIGAVVWTPSTFLSCDSCLITKIIPLSSQEYRVTVSDLSGCTATDYLLVVVKKDTKVYIPNAFSPDGNIINDNFTLYGDKKVKEIQLMQIYDRWGGLMFQAKNIPPNDPQYGWNGRTKGQAVELGVYVYYFEVEFTDGRIETFKGDVNIVTKVK